MNPALLNYLQQQQGSQMQPGQGQQMAQPQMQGQAPYNPFDVGIQKAIESARESLGMTQKQQDNALRNSMLAFANNMSQQPKERGFFNNFASIGKALNPALVQYGTDENAAIDQNNKLANQILHYQAEEQARQAQEEERAWRRQHAEAQLAEQKRTHDLMNNRYRGNNSTMENSPLAGNFIPIESKSERLMYTKDKKASGEILKELSSIKKDYDEFKTLSENDLINPMAQYGVGKVANAGKDFFGYFTGNEALRKETSKRKALDAKLGKFAIELERKIKGGVLSEGMVKRFENKGLLPSLGDAPDVFEEKLNNLTQEMGERYKASDASLRYGVHLSPYDLEELEKRTQSESTPMEEMTNQGGVLMQDANGEQYMIPAEAVEEAVNDGLEIIGR